MDANLQNILKKETQTSYHKIVLMKLICWSEYYTLYVTVDIHVQIREKVNPVLSSSIHFLIIMANLTNK